MKEIKMYVRENELNDEEKNTGKISYRRLIERISNGTWLFNNAPKLSDYDFIFELNSDYNEEEDEYIDIFQYYLIDIDDYIIKKLNDLECKDVIIAWSPKLEQYILMVEHYGTNWDYVMTDIEYTTDYEEADL